MRHACEGWPTTVLLMTMLLLGQATTARSADAQLGALVSPGRLSRAHSSLEGIANCLSCHTPGQGVAAPKCLLCHKPVADRIDLRLQCVDGPQMKTQHEDVVRTDRSSQRLRQR